MHARVSELDSYTVGHDRYRQIDENTGNIAVRRSQKTAPIKQKAWNVKCP